MTRPRRLLEAKSRICHTCGRDILMIVVFDRFGGKNDWVINPQPDPKGWIAQTDREFVEDLRFQVPAVERWRRHRCKDFKS